MPDLEGYEESRKIWKNSVFKGFLDFTMAKNLSSTGYSWKSYEDIDNLSPPDDKIQLYTNIGNGIRILNSLNKVEEEWIIYDKTNPGWWEPLFYF